MKPSYDLEVYAVYQGPSTDVLMNFCGGSKLEFGEGTIPGTSTYRPTASRWQAGGYYSVRIPPRYLAPSYSSDNGVKTWHTPLRLCSYRLRGAAEPVIASIWALAFKYPNSDAPPTYPVIGANFCTATFLPASKWRRVVGAPPASAGAASSTPTWTISKAEEILIQSHATDEHGVRPALVAEYPPADTVQGTPTRSVVQIASAWPVGLPHYDATGQQVDPTRTRGRVFDVFVNVQVFDHSNEVVAAKNYRGVLVVVDGTHYLMKTPGWVA